MLSANFLSWKVAYFRKRIGCQGVLPLLRMLGIFPAWLVIGDIAKCNFFESVCFRLGRILRQALSLFCEPSTFKFFMPMGKRIDAGSAELSRFCGFFSGGS